MTKQAPKPIQPKAKAIEDDDGWGMADTIRILIYGDSGSGKTTLASTFPGPITWLICSGGNRPGELKSIDTPANRKKIKPRVITSMAAFPGLLDEAAQREGTTVLDHASGLSDLILKEILGLEKLPEQKGWGMATQQQYGQLGQQCKEALRAILNLPGNVVILAQQRSFGGKDDGGNPDLVAPTVGASLTPSVTGWLNPAVDYVVNTFKMPKFKEVLSGPGKTPTMIRDKGVNYCLRTGPSDVYQTKFRMPVDEGRELPEFITLDPPSSGYDQIMALIKGG